MTATGAAAPVDPVADYHSRSWTERYRLRRDAGMGRRRSKPANAAVVHWLARRMARRYAWLNPLLIGPLAVLVQMWASSHGSYTGALQAILFAVLIPVITYPRLRRAAVENGRVLGLSETAALDGMTGLGAYVAGSIFLIACGVGALLRWPVQSP